MDVFLENAMKIFDVAQSDGNGEPDDFALLVRPDGGLHFVMASPLSLEAAAVHGGARTAYRVTKTASGGVRVAGRDGNRECILEQRGSENRFRAELLRDQPLYRISSPLTISAPSGCIEAGGAGSGRSAVAIRFE